MSDDGGAARTGKPNGDSGADLERDGGFVVHLAFVRGVAGEGPPRLVPVAPEIQPVVPRLLERNAGDTALVQWKGGAWMFA